MPDHVQAAGRTDRLRALAACVLLTVAPALAWPQAARAQAQAGAALQVTVTDIRKAAGHIRIAVCTKDTFLKVDCPFHGTVAAREGSVVMTIPGVTPGTYAVQAFQDEDDSGRMKRSLLGLPEEGFGFSRDAPANFGSPSFTAAAFQLSPGGGQVAFRLRYLD